MSRPLAYTSTLAADVIYPQGSIVVCRACGKPIYRLERSLYATDRPGRAAWKFAPVTLRDLEDLLQRSDVEAGHRAIVGAMSLDDRRLHCDRIPRLKAGDFADCPACQQSFVFAEAAGDDATSRFASKGYVIVLATIPPPGYARRAS